MTDVFIYSTPSEFLQSIYFVIQNLNHFDTTYQFTPRLFYCK